MKIDYAGNILISLRRIIQSIDKHNKQLDRCCELTVPQVVCLRQLMTDGELAPGKLAQAVYLSQATVTGIIDRLVSKGLVIRERSTVDRRQMRVRLTDRGCRAAKEFPWPLQERFSRQLDALNESEKEQIDSTLKQLVKMMEVPALSLWVVKPDAPGAKDSIGKKETMEKYNGCGC